MHACACTDARARGTVMRQMREDGLEGYGTGTFSDGVPVPVFALLPVSEHSRTLARHLGFVSVKVAHSTRRAQVV